MAASGQPLVDGREGAGCCVCFCACCLAVAAAAVFRNAATTVRGWGWPVSVPGNRDVSAAAVGRHIAA